MKKLFMTTVVSCVTLFLFGCGNVDADKSEDTNKTVETQEISTETSTENNTVSTTISGEFTVSVRDVIPDYSYDSTTPLVALVTQYQSYPFTMFVGEEIGAQLEPGNTYVFSVEPFTVDYPAEELQQMSLSSMVWEFDEFLITEFRLAEENELGMDSLSLSFTENENKE